MFFEISIFLSTPECYGMAHWMMIVFDKWINNNIYIYVCVCKQIYIYIHLYTSYIYISIFHELFHTLIHETHFYFRCIYINKYICAHCQRWNFVFNIYIYIQIRTILLLKWCLKSRYWLNCSFLLAQGSQQQRFIQFMEMSEPRSQRARKLYLRG